MPGTRPWGAALLAVALLAGACAADDDDGDAGSTTVADTATGDPSGSGPAGSGSTPTGASGTGIDAGAATTSEPAPASSTTTPPPIVPPPDPACAPGPDRVVTDLPDETIAAVVVEDYAVPAQEVDGGDIPAVRIDGFTIPARILDSGCRINFVAPAGCLGAIELSGAQIPEARIPGFVVDAVEVDGEELGPLVRREEIVLPAASTPAVRVEQTCEVVTDGEQRALVQPALVRPRVVRPEAVRRGVLRPPICVDDVCSDQVAVGDAIVPQASLAEVVVPELRAQVAEVGAASVVETPDAIAYTAPVDVLFDVESATLRPEAAEALLAIGAAIAAQPDGAISVEGHTDSDGEPAFNDDLSLRRAAAVADFLVTQAGLPADRITTVGYGENVPVASNDTVEGKALNRRVVVAIATA